MENLECPLCKQQTLLDPYLGIGHWYCQCTNCKSIIRLHRKDQQSFDVLDVTVDNRKQSSNRS